MSDKIVELIGIRKSYSADKQVLKGLELEINSGEMVIIEGKSGSGKSTLLNIVGLFEPFDEGQYIFDGKSLEKGKYGNYSNIRSNDIGFVFQAYHLIENISVWDNIMLPLYYGSAEKSMNENKLKALLREFNLSGLERKKVALLSGGEKQRVAILRAMIKEPKLIIADEPTGNLDEENSTIIINTFRSMLDTGKSVIMVTHNTNIATNDDKRYVLNEGRLQKC